MKENCDVECHKRKIAHRFTSSNGFNRESGKYYMSDKFNGRFNRMESVKKLDYFLHPR